MTWTYNAATIAGVPKDQVRLLIGDVIVGHPQLQDEEILFLITTRSSIYGAAAECCRSLQAKFSRSVDQVAGTSKIMYSQMAKAYAVKVNEFEAKAAATGAGVAYAGGISISDALVQELNQDRIPPQFNIGMDDNLIPLGPTGNEPESGNITGG